MTDGNLKTARIAVLGSRGMLGADMLACLTDHGCRVTGYSRPGWDLTDAACREQVCRDADIVINCAAYTNVDGAETDTAAARAVNETAVGELGQAAAMHGTRVVHFSTDFVYDGRAARPYTETDATGPLNAYGASKLAGEALLQASGCAALILRVEWTYGQHGSHFVSKLQGWAAGRDQLSVVADQTGSPTATTEIAEMTHELLCRDVSGLYLLAAAGYATRFEVAACVVAARRLTVGLKPCRTADFPAPAARPLNSRFDCTGVDAVLGRERRHWREVLLAFLGH